MSVLQIKRNELPTAKIPAAGSLLPGELAVDLSTQTLYSAKLDGSIVTLGGGSAEGADVVVGAGDTVTIPLPPFVTNTADAVVSVKVLDGAIWYDAYGVSSLAYQAGSITLTNNSTSQYTFRYKFLRG